MNLSQQPGRNEINNCCQTVRHWWGCTINILQRVIFALNNEKKTCNELSMRGHSQMSKPWDTVLKHTCDVCPTIHLSVWM